MSSPAKKKLKVSDESMSESKKVFAVDPVAFLDDVINSADDYLCNHMDALEKAIVKDGQIRDAEKRKRISEGVDALYDVLEKKAARNFDLFELYVLQQIFRAPEELATSMEAASQEQEDRIESDLQDLYRRLQRAQTNHRLLTREVKRRGDDVDGVRRRLAQAGLTQDNDPHSLIALLQPDTVRRVGAVVTAAADLVDRVGQLDMMASGVSSLTPTDNSSSAQQGATDDNVTRGGFTTFVQDVNSASIPLSQAQQMSDLLRQR